MISKTPSWTVGSLVTGTAVSRWCTALVETGVAPFLAGMRFDEPTLPATLPDVYTVQTLFSSVDCFGHRHRRSRWSKIVSRDCGDVKRQDEDLSQHIRPAFSYG